MPVLLSLSEWKHPHFYMGTTAEPMFCGICHSVSLASCYNVQGSFCEYESMVSLLCPSYCTTVVPHSQATVSIGMERLQASMKMCNCCSFSHLSQYERVLFVAILRRVLWIGSVWAWAKDFVSTITTLLQLRARAMTCSPGFFPLQSFVTLTTTFLLVCVGPCTWCTVKECTKESKVCMGYYCIFCIFFKLVQMYEINHVFHWHAF